MEDCIKPIDDTKNKIMESQNPTAMYPNPKAVMNSRESIILDIQHVKFPTLRLLNLASNLLTSVEALCLIDMPFLSSLYVSTCSCYQTTIESLLSNA
jgi:hypothetical protein